MPYSPQPPASIQTVDELRQWIQDELRNVSLAINETQILDLRPSFHSPDRLREGVMVYADGVNFNPGSGEGPYIWDGAAWRPMIGLTSTESAQIAANTAAIAANTSSISTNTSSITTLQATSPPGLVFLSSQTVSNAASVVFTGIGTTYDAYQFQITKMKPSVDAVNLWMQMSYNGGATWKNTSNVWVWVYNYMGGGATAYGHTSTAEGTPAYFRLGGATNTAWDNNSEVTLYPCTSGIGLNMITWRSVDWYSAGGGTYQVVGSGIEGSDASPCNAVRFLFSAGNMVSGRVSMYGVRKT